MKANLLTFFETLSKIKVSPETKEEIKNGAVEVASYAKEQFDDAKQEASEMWTDFLEKLKEKPIEADVVEYNLTELSMKDLVQIAKENIVKESTEVAVVKKIGTDDKIKVFLAYVSDGELLNIEKNKYIRINVKSLSDEVKELFGENDCVILK